MATNLLDKLFDADEDYTGIQVQVAPSNGDLVDEGGLEDVDGNRNQDVNTGSFVAASFSAPISGWYRVTYGAAFHSVDVGSRHIMFALLRRNGANYVPSETRCYIRNSGYGDRNSDSATVMMDLAAGDTVELLVGQDHGATGTTELWDHHLHAEPVINPVAMVYDSSGGQDYDASTITAAFDKDVVLDAPFSRNGSQLEVVESGWYAVWYAVTNHDTNQGDRQVVNSWLAKNGTAITPSDTYGYIRNDGDGDQTNNTACVLLQLSAGDYLELRQNKFSKSSSGSSVTLGGLVWLAAEKLNTDDVLVITTSGYSFNSGWQAVSFDTTIQAGPSYTHDPATDNTTVTIQNSGWYEVTLTGASNDTGDSGRHQLDWKLMRNGGKIPGTTMLAYSRGITDGHVDGVSTAMALYLAAGDVITAEFYASTTPANAPANGVWLTIRPAQHGYHEQFDLSDYGKYLSSSLSWADAAGTSTAKARLSDDGGATWGQWQPVANGSELPGMPTEFVNHWLEMWIRTGEGATVSGLDLTVSARKTFLKKWDGGQWVIVSMKRWDGAQFVASPIKVRTESGEWL